MRESALTCSLCEKRKAKRFCPARAENICTVCCGTEREVSLDCPSDCAYLMESRRHDWERREIDWSQIPFAEIRLPSAFVTSHEKLILALSYAVCLYARENAPLVDSDALGAMQSLGESYRTLSGGIYYEKPPDYQLQRGLYDALKVAIEDFTKSETQRAGLAMVRDGEIRDALIFLAQLGGARMNGRPRSRAYLDFLRSQFKPEEFLKPASGRLVVL